MPKKAAVPLVIHFDVNETILVGDEAGGDSSEDCLNKMLAKSAFVRIPSTSGSQTQSVEDTSKVEPIEWWNGAAIQAPPGTDDGGSTVSPPPLHTAWDWPVGCCPYYRTKYKKRAKTFLTHHGYGYLPVYQQLHDNLIKTNDHAIYKEYPILAHIVPAFWETLVALAANEAEQPFHLVFRSFGSDLPDLVPAVTAFCKGLHPDYPNFSSDRLILTLDRLVQGKWIDNPDKLDTNNPFVYQLVQGERVVAMGDKAVLEWIHQHPVSAIQDHYAFWDCHGCQPWAGKPIWKIASHHHLLLDDNIHNLETDSIASVRQLTGDGFQTLDSQHILKEHGVHLIRVPTVEPILNRQWFLDQIRAAHMRFLESTEPDEKH